MTRLSVGFINNFNGPTLGGGEVQLLALMRGLRAGGVDLALACSADSALATAAAEIPGIRVSEIDFERGGLVRQMAHALEGASIIQGTGFFTNILARRVGRSMGLPVINGVHVMPDAPRFDGHSRFEGILRFLLERPSRRRVDRFVVVSQAVADALAGRGVKRQRITVVPNGIDVISFRVAAAQPLGLGLPYAPRRVGYIGRLERVKGCEYFLAAASLIAERDPAVRFVVVGSGSIEAALLDLAAASPVAGRIDFLGHVPEVAPLYPLLDVVCVPSLSEAFGLSAVEALALGVPVVASAVGGLPEVVQDGVTGRLVPPGDPSAIASAVLDILGDPERARAMGTAGADRVEDTFTAEAMILGYLRVYEDVLTAP
ncbi:MAG: glycosyltransferase family 4 protein [Coriobacteriia bacterium]